MNSIKVEWRYSSKSKSFFKKHGNIEHKFKDNIVKYYFECVTDNINIKKMQGTKNWNRMAIDKYRVIYCIINKEIIIIDVLLAGKRGDVYKQFGKRK